LKRESKRGIESNSSYKANSTVDYEIDSVRNKQYVQ